MRRRVVDAPVAPQGRRLLGFDPGFASLGWAVLELGAVPRALALGVFETEASPKKRKVLTVDDNLRRAQEVAAFVDHLVEGWSPSAVCAEAMSFPRNASAAAKVAMTWGVLAFVSRSSLPLLQATPQEIKVAACGAKTATKAEVEAEMRRRYGVTHLPGLPETNAREHAFDALGAIHACLRSDLVRILRAT